MVERLLIASVISVSDLILCFIILISGLAEILPVSASFFIWEMDVFSILARSTLSFKSKGY